MSDRYFIDGKRVNQKQWYAHLGNKYQELHELLKTEQSKSAELNELAGKHFSDAVEWREKAESAEATIAAMRSVIINAEWVGISHPSGFVRFCSVCRNVEQDGHKPDCPMPKALSNTAGAEYAERDVNKSNADEMKYRKKPVVVDAMQWDGKNHRGMFDFLTGTIDKPMNTFDKNFYIDHNKVAGGLVIKTLEGEHIASIGDYIVRGVKGEFYPCKPDVFHLTYESVCSEDVLCDGAK